MAATGRLPRHAPRRLRALDGDPADLGLHRLQGLPHPVPERRPLRGRRSSAILVSVLIDAWLIGRLNDLYVRVTGTNRLVPIRPTWLRSMRDTGPAQNSVTVVEAVMMSSVLLAALALIVWFFLLAGSPMPNQ